MVKIKNVLGDVKIGRQGEVVYQRKYGEQIRRLASPKRAMASEAQIAHRQLYRDALVWRKALSLANRRYLEEYCIANGVVDSYHIPLPWSRFALKLYLQAVKFVLTDISVTDPTYESQKYESYETGDDNAIGMYDNMHMGQSFTPTEAHKITSVWLKLYRQGMPGTFYVEIKATDGEGKPTGAVLCSGTIDGNSLTPDAPGDWYEIKLGEGSQLAADTTYAKILHVVGGSPTVKVMWRYDSTGTYTIGGLLYSTDYGESWTLYATIDGMFQEWSTITTAGKKTAILHVRHPALLAVVHKRGELTVREYENLSSLDKEYLTGQVGLDVEAGDSIETTTLPGIDYRFKVA